MKHLWLLGLLAPLISLGQQGIRFQDELSWEQIREKARKENKYIFMDCFTTWCGPCKNMAQFVFPKAEVGQFYNRHFISVSVQLDTTRHDNDTVRAWYRDAQFIMSRFGVRSFPTFLFFSPDGKPVHRAIGSMSVEALIKAGEQALDPASQYYTLLARYMAGDKDTVLLRQLAEQTYFADRALAGQLADDYILQCTDRISPDKLRFMLKHTVSAKSKGFKILLDSMAAIEAICKGDAAMPFSRVMNVVTAILHADEGVSFYPAIDRGASWETLRSYLTGKYPAIGQAAFLKTRYNYYYRKRDMEKYASLFLTYVNRYPTHADDFELNQRAWDVFEKTDNKVALKAALQWMKNNREVGQHHAPTDTYANLLYALGRQRQAMEWEAKAISLADPDSREAYLETLEKMKANAPLLHPAALNQR